MANVDALNQSGQIESDHLKNWLKIFPGANKLLDFLQLKKLRTLACKNDPRILETKSPLKIAIIGSCSFHPLMEILEENLWNDDFKVSWYEGGFDSYHGEILNETSGLYAHKPDLVIFIPGIKNFLPEFNINLTQQELMDSISSRRDEILNFCDKLNRIHSCQVILCNFLPPAHFDLGPFGQRSLISPWNFIRELNIQLGLSAPSYVSICDVEFLAYRSGALKFEDKKAWYTSRQIGSIEFQIVLGKELAHISRQLKKAPKKVLVLDLDNTLWGGVIGDDGLQGINLGDTSPAGESFKEFQKYIKGLKNRGIILAVCSKNEYQTAIEPFTSHPETVLRLEDFASFKANWSPKSENIKQIAIDLNLGTDSFVFVDDNPAEIEIVNQFLPEVATITLNKDPSSFVSMLQDSRYFETLVIGKEDLQKSEIYRQEGKRQLLKSEITDVKQYLKSLEMKGNFSPISQANIPRVSQLLNKSNQFNLMTIRMTEAEVANFVSKNGETSFVVRLEDKFGDYGLVGIILGERCGDDFHIRNWVMSCRVLERQLEEEIINFCATISSHLHLKRIIGHYSPTKKNVIVKDLYSKLGFSEIEALNPGTRSFFLGVNDMKRYETFISVLEGTYD